MGRIQEEGLKIEFNNKSEDRESNNTPEESHQKIPKKLERLLVQLEHDKIIKKIQQGILLNEKISKKTELQEQSKNLIINAFEPNDSEFLLHIFNLLLKSKYNFLVIQSVLNHFRRFFPLENLEQTQISTGEEKHKKKEKTSGPSGGSLLPPSSKGITRVKDEDRAIVESSPLVDLEKIVQEPIDELGVSIDPDPIFHAIRLKYLFGSNERGYDKKSQAQIQKEDELYDKIVENLRPYFKFKKEGKPQWDDQGWAWPDLANFQDRFPMHFTIQMHENGRFIIPLKREMNLKEFLYDLTFVFSRFLNKEELEFFFSCLLLQKKDGRYFRKEDGNYIHLAHKISPEDLIDEKLNKARVKIRFIDYGRNPRIKVYVDKSKGPEIEGEFDNPEGRDLFNTITNGAIVTSNLSNIHEQLKVQDSDHNYLMGLAKQTYNVSANTGQSLQLLQKNITTNHHDALSYLSEIELNRYNSDLQQEIRHVDLTTQLRVIKKQFPELKEMVSRFYSSQTEENKKHREALIKLIISLLNFDADHKSDLEEHSSFLESKVEQVFLDTSREIHDAKKETMMKIDTTKDEIVKAINERFDSMSETINKEFESVRFRIKNALYLVLRKLETNPGLTVKQLSNDFKVSQKTVYSYLKKLQDKNLVVFEKGSSSKRGRPPRSFKLNRKKILSQNKNKKEVDEWKN